MNLMETRSSSGSGRSTPSYCRSPASSSGGFAPSNANSSVLTFSLAIAACLLLFLHTYHDSSAGSNAAQAPGRRSWKEMGTIGRDAALQQLLLKKDQELEGLRTALQGALGGNAVKEGNMQAQEGAIRLLQQRSEKERTARSKAQFALSERVQQNAKCTGEVATLEAELVQCGVELRRLVGVQAPQQQQHQAQQPRL